MTTNICLLVRSPFDDPENGIELARASLRMGLATCFGAMDTLSLRNGKVVCNLYDVTLSQSGDLNINSQPHTGSLHDFDHVQVLSFGRRQAFLDKLQLLKLLSETTSIANSVDALTHLNSKYYLAGMGEVFRYPETFASPDADYLWSVISGSDKQWIVKPPAEAFGRDVFLISRKDTNARAILHNMTGNGSGRYCLLQQYIPEIREGEKRVLIAGGKTVGYYRRKAVLDHRTNLAQGADCEPCSLTPDESTLCERLGPWLMERGVAFAGIDLVYPFVIEFNVLSPGGIRTIRNLTGIDLGETVLRHILP